MLLYTGKRRAIALSLAVLSVFWTAPALVHAYSYSGNKWAGNTVSVDVSDASWPSDWISPLASAMSAWNGATSPFTLSSGISGHKFTRSNMGAGALALTTDTFSGSTIVDADTNFNTYYGWSTTGAAGLYDVQSVAAHELGHWLRLLDLSGGGDTEKTMYYSIATGETKKRTLESDDLNGINAIYP